MTQISTVDLSIIIVSWNTADMTCACLDSVFANSGKLGLEVILIDNASSDGSAERIAKSYPQVNLIANASNLGFGAANNQGFKVAKGRYLLALNSDTLLLGDVLQKSIDYLDWHPDVGAMGCRVLNPDRTMQPTCSGYPTLTNLTLQLLGLNKLGWPPFLDRYRMERWDRRSERQVAVISGCYLMVRRKVIEQAGAFDEDFFFFGEETDWCFRISKAGWKLMFAPVGEIIHYGGGSVRRLDFRRDMMLSSAMVKLHLKNGGIAAALVAMTIVSVFNISRLCYYAVLSLISRSSRALERRQHFFRIVLNWRQVWPKGRTYHFDQ